MLTRPSIKAPARFPVQNLLLGLTTLGTGALSIYLAISAPQFRVHEVEILKISSGNLVVSDTDNASEDPQEIASIEEQSEGFKLSKITEIFGTKNNKKESTISTPLHLTPENMTGSGRVTTHAVRHLSDIRYEEHLATLNTELIEHRIKTHPWIKDAKVSRSLPSTVEIEIVEYKPRLLLSLGLLWYVDRSGDIFRQADTSNLNFPVLTGIPQSWAVEHPKAVRQILKDSLKMLDACDVPLIGGIDAISEIHFDSLSGFELVLRNGSVITFGFYEPQSRLDRLRKMIVYGLDLSIPQHISLDDDDVAISKPLLLVSQSPQSQQ